MKRQTRLWRWVLWRRLMERTHGRTPPPVDVKRRKPYRKTGRKVKRGA